MPTDRSKVFDELRVRAQRCSSDTKRRRLTLKYAVKHNRSAVFVTKEACTALGVPDVLWIRCRWVST